MSVTHIRARTGVAYCGAVPSGPWESISLPHWQLARQAPDWMGLQAHPTPLCEQCRLETALLPPQSWPSLGATGARPSARWLGLSREQMAEALRAEEQARMASNPHKKGTGANRIVGSGRAIQGHGR